jgi:CRP/FNR family transcriptional regulator
MNTKIFNLLQSAAYFSDLEDQILEDIVRALVPRTYTPDQIIQIEGQPTRGMYLIESGCVKAIKISPEGKEQILNILGPGEIFNTISVFNAGRAPATIEALEETTTWSLPQDSFLSLIDRHPPLSKAVIRILADRVQHLLGLVEDLSLRTVESRLAHKLLEEAQNGELDRKPWATQTEMAAHMGTVTDVLNRALRNLAKENLVHVSRDQIRILDPQGLKKRALLK